MQQFTAVVLAAGLGKRMKSKIPKVLHPICGLPMVQHVVNTAFAAGFGKIVVVVGHGGEGVRRVLGDRVEYAAQSEQLGTGHALLCARDAAATEHVIVLSGDAPLLAAETLAGLARRHLDTGAGATVLTAELEDPSRYGRVMRDESGSVLGIVEEKDATPEERAIREVNTGTYCFKRRVFDLLESVGTENAQGEYYLTDALSAFRREGASVEAQKLDDPREGEAPNDRVQLAATAALMQHRILENLMLSGVTIVDPSNTYVDAGVVVGADTVLLPGTMLHGATVIGENCTIGPFSQVRDTEIGNGVTIQQSVVVGSRIDHGATIGPFSYLRPETVVKQAAKVGGFVEVKKSTIGEKSKVPHLSYVGDCTIGTGVNIGAGTIVVNYDGVHKHPTVIGDRAFIGSNTNLIAPVTVGEDAFVAAGSTINRPVPEGALAIGRARQVVKENWRRKRD